ncbi:hypothetical protein JCGZ_13422 [Jatropha curcas]|uniref:Pentacotripeptide-repeat region of PRORP domain-containing protein n=1 Tax=Jatropha curcas TaxID=180498 RepID=A0A067KAI0_JATCU|nr:pentatricopeptide repeat-containing protein At1g77360, mitochondrial [Jatropha curcas]KDP33157.1 hypothetical protein JCGZ_13422 [Jatropha curcas]
MARTSNRKRIRSGSHHDDHHHRDAIKKHHFRSPSSSSRATAEHQSSYSPKRPNFPSYIDTPNLPSKIKLLCELIANTPSSAVESAITDAGVRVSQSDVEQVLKLSYSFPGPAVKFFRWSGFQLQDNHSPYSWNLVVDLLGKNCLFDAMWDAIKSMKREGLVSLATFASVFGSYVIAGQVKDAIMTFEVMDQYGCSRDIVALNSLLSAICRDGKTDDALQFLRVAKNAIRPDADTYAILLEGCEKEGNVLDARETFMELVNDIGWDPSNLPAYDTFLCTLLMGREGLNEAIQFLQMMKDRSCFPGIRFFRAALQECLKLNDIKRATYVWEVMVERKGFMPDTELYNLMIALHCYTCNTDVAEKFLDEMVYNGAFPDRQTYDVLFQFLIKGRKLKAASAVFNEMIKNEYVPNQANCSAAVRVYMHSQDPCMAIKIWKCMVENYESDLEETGNLLVSELCDLHMDPEALKYTEGMVEKGIRVTSSSLAKLKQRLIRGRKEFVYEALVQKLKAH